METVLTLSEEVVVRVDVGDGLDALLEDALIEVHVYVNGKVQKLPALLIHLSKLS